MAGLVRTVLVSGASIAGPTLAFWLARTGVRVTVVERARGVRGGGYPIDVRGDAVRIAERMGIAAGIREHAVHMSGIIFANERGRQTAHIVPSPTDDLELARGDLVELLYGAMRDDVEYIFGDSIASLDVDAVGVDVAFSSGARRRFDLVVGADGLHSETRRLAFGAEQRCERHLGYCFAAAEVEPDPDQARESVVIHNAPGRMASIYDYRGKATAMLAFRSKRTPSKLAEQQELVTAAFAHDDGRARLLLDKLLAAPSFYFDTVSQVRLPAWSRDRVALIGDAAHCTSFLSGRGTSLAMLGGFALADALGSCDDLRRAFACYEAAHRPAVRTAQRAVGIAAHILMPHTRVGIGLRDLVLRTRTLVAGSFP